MIGNSGATQIQAGPPGAASTQDSGVKDSTSSDSGGDLADSSADVGPAVVKGAIQKGPFVLGSTVTISAIDGAGVPTGQV